jgi:hypothetical protein
MTQLDPSKQSVWESVAPLLDEAMGRLRPIDQDAVLLRLFEQRDLREVAQALGLSAEATDERVTRALEKLRNYLVRKGVKISTAVLASVLAANAVQEAPVGLAASVVAAVMAETLPANQLAANRPSPRKRDLPVLFALGRRRASRQRMGSEGQAVTATKRPGRTAYQSHLPQRRPARNCPFPRLPRLGLRPFNRVSLFTNVKSDSWRRRLFPNK